MTIGPLSPAAAADLSSLEPAQGFDAYLVTGGYPRILVDWEPGAAFPDFVRAELRDTTSILVVAGQRIMDAEFPSDLQAATVLRTIGSGESVYARLQQRAGVSAAALSRALSVLVDAKRVVVREVPVSTAPSREARYRIADPYLRFWLRFVEPGIPDIERGRPDIVAARIARDWPAYRGRAVEPVVREALTRLAAGDPRLGGAAHVGGWWPRTNQPEVDPVGTDRRQPPAGRVCFVGSVKWRDDRGFGTADLDQLVRDQALVPGGAGAPRVAVSLAEPTVPPTAVATYRPADLLAAWRRPV